MLRIIKKTFFIRHLRKVTESCLSSKDCSIIFDKLYAYGIDVEELVLSTKLYKEYLKVCTLPSDPKETKYIYRLIGDIKFGFKSSPTILNNLLPNAVLVIEGYNSNKRNHVYIYLSPFSEKVL